MWFSVVWGGVGLVGFGGSSLLFVWVWGFAVGVFWEGGLSISNFKPVKAYSSPSGQLKY